MNSGMIAKMEKAHRYTEERDRFRFDGLRVTIQGDNSAHTVGLDSGNWSCDCDFFAHNAACAHTMAVGLMLDGMVPDAMPVPALA